MSEPKFQLNLFENELESDSFLKDQIITYIGNKRTLLSFIGQGIAYVKQRLGKKRLIMFDGFSGSGVVARYFKQHASVLYANDLEMYSQIVNQCYLSNKSEVDIGELGRAIDYLNKTKLKNHHPTGFVEKLYSPQEDTNIKLGERVFYTNQNHLD